MTIETILKERHYERVRDEPVNLTTEVMNQSSPGRVLMDLIALKDSEPFMYTVYVLHTEAPVELDLTKIGDGGPTPDQALYAAKPEFFGMERQEVIRITRGSTGNYQVSYSDLATLYSQL